MTLYELSPLLAILKQHNFRHEMSTESGYSFGLLMKYEDDTSASATCFISLAGAINLNIFYTYANSVYIRSATLNPDMLDWILYKLRFSPTGSPAKKS